MSDPDFRPEAFLVDLDGVLVHSHDVHVAAYERALARHGFELGADARALVLSGAARERVLERTAVPEGLVGEVSEEKEAAFVELMADGGLVPSPGAEPFLRALVDAGCPVALVSNSATAARCVTTLGLGWALAAIVGPDDVERTKPDPDSFLRAASLLGVDPERCVAVEDSSAGAAAARAAGTFVVGVGPRLGPDQVDLLVPDLDAVPLDRWLGGGAGGAAPGIDRATEGAP